MCLIPFCVRNKWNFSETNWGPLSDTITLGSPSWENKIRNFSMVFVVVVLFIGKISTHFECASMMSRNIEFIKGQQSLYVSGPRVPLASPKDVQVQTLACCYSAAIVKVDKSILSYPISCILHPILQISSILSYPIPYLQNIGMQVKWNEI